MFHPINSHLRFAPSHYCQYLVLALTLLASLLSCPCCGGGRGLAGGVLAIEFNSLKLVTTMRLMLPPALDATRMKP